MVGSVDGDLPSHEATWLSGHLEACPECRAALVRLTEIDSELTAWGRRLACENPPPADSRERLAAAFTTLPARRRAMHWMPAAAVAVAAALVLALLAPQRTQRRAAAGGQSEGQFIEIPYVAPLDPHENATIVRMNIRVATLLALGFRVSADPDAIVVADVLVGEDGRAHALRVISDIAVN
jgi:anti-sigma factor RsiW